MFGETYPTVKPSQYSSASYHPFRNEKYMTSALPQGIYLSVCVPTFQGIVVCQDSCKKPLCIQLSPLATSIFYLIYLTHLLFCQHTDLGPGLESTWQDFGNKRGHRALNLRLPCPRQELGLQHIHRLPTGVMHRIFRGQVSPLKLWIVATFGIPVFRNFYGNSFKISGQDL